MTDIYAPVGVPRYMIHMSLYGGGFEVGYNKHYHLHVPYHIALQDFFLKMNSNYAYGRKIDLKRSKLGISFLDLPEQKEVELMEKYPND